MGMSVKGATQHRLVRRGMRKLLDSPETTAAERETCAILIRRADLAVDRIKMRKWNRERRREASV